MLTGICAYKTMRGKAQFCVSSKEVRFNEARLQKKLSSQPKLTCSNLP